MGQRVVRVLLVALGVLLISTGSLIGQNAGDAPLTLPLQFAGTAFGQAGSAAGKSFGFTVFIDQWTTDEQVESISGYAQGKRPGCSGEGLRQDKRCWASVAGRLCWELFSLCRYTLRRAAECTS